MLRPYGRLRSRHVVIAVLVSCVPRTVDADDDAQVRFTPRQLRRILRLSPLGPPPPTSTNSVADDPRAARLGQYLFFDTRLSGNDQVSCATCHQPDASFADTVSFSRGVGIAQRHTPALWNVAYNRWYFWDGRADTLWSQALDPIENPREMASTRMGVIHRIYNHAPLRRAYESVFGKLPNLSDQTRFPAAARPVPANPGHNHHQSWMRISLDDRRLVNRAFANVGKALEAYQRQIISINAPFDVFVEGLRDNDAAKRAAISPSSQRGLQLFVDRANCWLCHSGPNFTDGEFHDTRVPPHADGNPGDSGRYDGITRLLSNPFNGRGAFADARDAAAIAKLEHLAQRPDFVRQFKTPSLRNVAQTPPYMHEGQFASLRDVIHYYSTLEGAVAGGHHRQESILKPLGLSESQILDLIAFLESLTDEKIDPSLMTQPHSPIESP